MCNAQRRVKTFEQRSRIVANDGKIGTIPTVRIMHLFGIIGIPIEFIFLKIQLILFPQLP